MHYFLHIESFRHPRPFLATTITGGVLLLAGVALLALTTISFLLYGAAEWHRYAGRIATTTTLVGFGLILYAGIRTKGRSIEEGYRLGYDLGFENGFQSHVSELVESLERAERKSNRSAPPPIKPPRKKEHAAVADLERAEEARGR